MGKEKKEEKAPKPPAKGVKVNPNTTKEELGEEDLKKVAGGRARSLTACTCSNMPSDPGRL